MTHTLNHPSTYICLKLLHFLCVPTPIVQLLCSHRVATDDDEMTVASDKHLELVNLGQKGLEANTVVGRKGKPQVLSSPPSVGLLCVAVYVFLLSVLIPVAPTCRMEHL
jgi:hypothetical protein